MSWNEVLCVITKINGKKWFFSYQKETKQDRVKKQHLLIKVFFQLLFIHFYQKSNVNCFVFRSQWRVHDQDSQVVKGVKLFHLLWALFLRSYIRKQVPF